MARRTAEQVDVAGLASALGLHVNDERWYQQAFSHSSYVNELGQVGVSSYERLEFLGDAVVNLVIALHLFERYPSFPEGDLSRLRAAVVRATTLSARAKALGIGRFALLGRGEELAGGRRRLGFLADLFEAMVGAMFLDSGFDAAQDFLLKHLAEDIEVAVEGAPQANYKAMLQDSVQRDGAPPVDYRVLGARGPDHAKMWTCEVRIGGRACGVGTGRTKKGAEQDAARQALLLGWGAGA